MGGKEGALGYLVQAMVCVVNSLLEENWTFVQIEPDTSNDKVDIAWYFEDKNPEMVQVKSSKNNFTLPDIRRWIQKTIEDAPDASEYRLILIGTCNDTTKKALNRIHESNVQEDDLDDNELLKTNLDKIKIQLENYDQEALESKIYRYLGRYLSDKGKNPTAIALDMMSRALGYTFMAFSTQGRKDSRDEFESRLMEWVNFNLRESEGRKSDLQLAFYLSNMVPYSTSMKKIFSRLSETRFEKEKQDVLLLFDKINGMVLPLKERNEEPKENPFGISILLHRYCEFTGDRRKGIFSLCQKLLGREPDDDFFYVGNLKQSTLQGVRTMFSTPPVERIGDEEEKEKFEAILELEDKLEALNAKLEMYNYLDSHFLIPLVLRNVGIKHDEKIRVRIEIDQSVSVVTSRNVKQPDVYVIDDFTGEHSVLHRMLSHRENPNIRPYPHKPYELPVPPIPFMDNDERVKRLISKFRRYVGVLFDFDIYRESDKNVLIFDFDELNPKESLAFPCFFLVRAGKSFEMKYEITSQNLGDVSKGYLSYEI